ncbi:MULTISPECIES: LuxR C-terminal-related transcriptional regulator [unclassified Serratia (in: enterobacteria)]|uniref:LuxR C-terminal-related transcriptional regulator n=1 Tax=unclassified Serratia (in: enterobacteria) TaxID=2647522 RepID=UPI00046AC020|nr:MULTISPECIES: LuxR C-terminal-related transcriptional regulator [unclassified Serratia (in: enterobacteria)]
MQPLILLKGTHTIMMHKSVSSRIAILYKNHLFRLGMEKFVRDLQLGYRCVLKASSLLRLSQKMSKASISILIVELTGTQEWMRKYVRKLLTLSAQHPKLNIIIYITSQKTAAVEPLLQHQQFSLISHQESSEQMFHDMRYALADINVCSPKIKKSMELLKNNTSASLDTLTHFERKVLTHIFAGLSLQDIAMLHKRSIKTISAQKRSSMRKLGVSNDSELFGRVFNEMIEHTK